MQGPSIPITNQEHQQGLCFLLVKLELLIAAVHLCKICHSETEECHLHIDDLFVENK